MTQIKRAEEKPDRKDGQGIERAGGAARGGRSQGSQDYQNTDETTDFKDAEGEG